MPVLHLEPMTRTLKTFLLWLLIAAMPFQAFAANVLRACSSGHQGTTMMSVTSTVHGDASVTSHVGVMDQQLDAEEECPKAASSVDQSDDSSDAVKHGSCSACAACCIGAVVPPQLFSFKASFNNAEVYETFGTTLVAGFIPDSLERPPRHFAA